MIQLSLVRQQFELLSQVFLFQFLDAVLLFKEALHDIKTDKLIKAAEKLQQARDVMIIDVI